MLHIMYNWNAVLNYSPFNSYTYPNVCFSVKTDLLTRGAISRLSIAFATNYDSGNYTCSMRSAQTSVIVHILNGMEINKVCDIL